MQMTDKQRERLINHIAVAAAWIVAALFFFPIFWMVLTSFKTELEAIAVPPTLFFEPTLENYTLIEERTDYFRFALNSVITSFGGTLLAMLIAIPSAYAMAFNPTRRTKDILLWMLSTKMLPAVGVLMPIYLICQRLGLLDTHIALIFIFAMINLPIIMMILFNYFREIPKEIIEASRMDGATTFGEITQIVMPLAWGGIASTALLSIVLLWNEAFWSINLTSSDAGTLVVLVASFTAPEGLFWAKLSAVSTLACAPIVVFGWLTQKQLVQGLTFGAVK
ncbi:MAG: carbohydrate ABC transporter permease [Alphaproteobacteria bacterium]|nr:carbohydrate ABC transporter permease [Alphaproteobacteria bacterium]MDA7982660.1 carbohydrate ABC transporter permease [Alphaproteobacteria bacterium]MDA7984067.1 carbohydrate ABC transporter permease [Alphaproteobacteria bacterium]MDA7987165.1 carbohydrate ABC transporter permease [Alphaproteobacteria bacterium]MDA7988596.1 carbohydrate ABC transporter permease [Alphaproteobacteria bacterium]